MKSAVEEQKEKTCGQMKFQIEFEELNRSTTNSGQNTLKQTFEQISKTPPKHKKAAAGNN